MFFISVVHKEGLSVCREEMGFKTLPVRFLYKTSCLPCLFWKRLWASRREQILGLNEPKQVKLVSRAIPQSSPVLSST